MCAEEYKTSAVTCFFDKNFIAALRKEKLASFSYPNRRVRGRLSQKSLQPVLILLKSLSLLI